ncbi:helix-turn-helix domain-containing protein [Ruegeria sp. HKCCD4884]|uniref:helix-turn-helix domain-containing protein n=1 Tax=Ruegeria sp. HKCCD4884 TaxID=2683022 RepID=UPI001491E219|nr:AraC family transcriptional regulator [Ruegeria sp. HKCCD4884]NOD94460.1 helix-turn-helix domain-containing protein [Ruegeria sp. HKCCD4884]
MSEISYKQLPDYAPGNLLGSGDGRGWSGINYRSYRHLGMEIELPPMEDFLVIAYDKGRTPVQRKVGNTWSDYSLGVGDLTLLNKSDRSEWAWSETVEVSHVYLSAELVESVANEVYEQDVRDIRLRDTLKARDPGISRCVSVIKTEVGENSVGGSLIVEAAAREMSVRLLRKYADTRFGSAARFGKLSRAETKRVVAFVQDQLREKLSYEQAAAEMGLGDWNFMRKFKSTFGHSFHDYVLTQRVERAVSQLRNTRKPIKNIALDCGFYDQPHMNRVFKKIKGVTPGSLRRT